MIIFSRKWVSPTRSCMAGLERSRSARHLCCAAAPTTAGARLHNRNDRSMPSGACGNMVHGKQVYSVRFMRNQSVTVRGLHHSHQRSAVSSGHGSASAGHCGGGGLPPAQEDMGNQSPLTMRGAAKAVAAIVGVLQALWARTSRHDADASASGSDGGLCQGACPVCPCRCCRSGRDGSGGSDSSADNSGACHRLMVDAAGRLTFGDGAEGSGAVCPRCQPAHPELSMRWLVPCSAVGTNDRYAAHACGPLSTGGTAAVGPASDASPRHGAIGMSLASPPIRMPHTRSAPACMRLACCGGGVEGTRRRAALRAAKSCGCGAGGGDIAVGPRPRPASAFESARALRACPALRALALGAILLAA